MIFLPKLSLKMKIQVFWNITQCGIVKSYGSLHELEFLDYPEYRGGNLHRNVRYSLTLKSLN